MPLRVAVTRSEAGKAGCDLSARLRDRGFDVVAAPLTRTTPPEDEAPLARALSQIGGYDWLVVTSARSARPLHRLLVEPGGDIGQARAEGLRVCAVGTGTARALERVGIPVDLIPRRFLAEGVVEVLLERGVGPGSRILFPRAEGGRDVIPRLLSETGAVVDAPSAYRTVSDPEAAADLVRRIARGEMDVLTFTAGSAATAFGNALAYADPDAVEAIDRVGIVVLGPATADALEAEGLRVDRVAMPHTFEGLVEAVAAWSDGRLPRS